MIFLEIKINHSVGVVYRHLHAALPGRNRERDEVRCQRRGGEGGEEEEGRREGVKEKERREEERGERKREGEREEERRATRPRPKVAARVQMVKSAPNPGRAGANRVNHARGNIHHIARCNI